MKKDELRVSVIQTEIIWEDAQANRDHFAKMIDKIEESDLIVLPEMFTTAFSMDTSKSEAFSTEMKTLVWMKAISSEKNCLVMGSVSASEMANGNGEWKFYNRMIVAFPNGTHQTYDKRHLFTPADEAKFFTHGTERLIIEWQGWKICPLICYDLRFPVWSRNKISNGEPEYDLLIYVANWPSARRNPWMKLLMARAIENQSYVIGANRIGVDGYGIEYSGDSMIIDPKGEMMKHGKITAELLEGKLSLKELDAFRKKFPVLHDGSY